MLLGSLIRGLKRSDMLERVDGYKNAADGVSFEQVLEAIEYIESWTWEGESAVHGNDPCRLMDLIDPILSQAQACLKVEPGNFAW